MSFIWLIPIRTVLFMRVYLSWARNSPPFMELKRLLPRWQEPTTVPYNEPCEFYPHRVFKHPLSHRPAMFSEFCTRAVCRSTMLQFDHFKHSSTVVSEGRSSTATNHNKNTMQLVAAQARTEILLGRKTFAFGTTQSSWVALECQSPLSGTRQLIVGP